MADRRSVLSDSDADSLLSVGTIATSSSSSQHSRQEIRHDDTRQTQAAKALYLAEENASRTPSLRSVSASVATGSSDRTDSLFLRGSGPAPPNYAEALAQGRPIWPRATDDADEEDSLYAVTEEDAPFDRPFFSGDYKSLRRFAKRNWRGLALLNLGIYCVFAIVILVVALRNSREVVYVTKYDLFPPDHPDNEENMYHPEKFHHNTSQCTFTSYRDAPDLKYFPFQWYNYIDPKTFSFKEMLQAEYQDLDDVSIVGKIEVRPGAYSQVAPIRIAISYATTSNWRAAVPSWYMDTETLWLYRSPSDYRDAPDNILRAQSESSQYRPNVGDGGKACLSIWIGIYVLAPVDNFNIQTENLHVDVGRSPTWPANDPSTNRPWSFRIRDTSSIYTTTGNIATSNWDSRNTNITSESGSIRGEYELNDNLHMETKTGDIEVLIKQRAAYAKLYSTCHPPDTPANASIITSSGRQIVEFYQGASELAQSGNQGIEYPFLMRSSHRSDTGNILISTGSFWEGQIHGRSLNGSVDFEGKSLGILPRPINKIKTGNETERWARQGIFPGQMDIEAGTGNISLCAAINYWECSQHFSEFSNGHDFDNGRYRSVWQDTAIVMPP